MYQFKIQIFKIMVHILNHSPWTMRTPFWEVFPIQHGHLHKEVIIWEPNEPKEKADGTFVLHVFYYRTKKYHQNFLGLFWFWFSASLTYNHYSTPLTLPVTATWHTSNDHFILIICLLKKMVTSVNLALLLMLKIDWRFYLAEEWKKDNKNARDTRPSKSNMPAILLLQLNIKNVVTYRAQDKIITHFL